MRSFTITLGSLIIILGVPSQLSCADFPYFMVPYFFFLLYSFVFDNYTSVATLVLVNYRKWTLETLHGWRCLNSLQLQYTDTAWEYYFLLRFFQALLPSVAGEKSDATLFSYLRKSANDISYFLLRKYGEFSTIFSVDFNDALWRGNIFIHRLGL